MASLYELSNDARELANMLSDMEYLDSLDFNDEEVEVTQEEALEKKRELAEQVFAKIQEMIVNKSAGLVKYVRILDSYSNEVTQEKRLLEKRKKQLDNRINSIKGYIRTCMQMQGVKRLETPIGNISLRKGRGSAVINDLDLIPDEYKKTEIEIKPMKTEIVKAIKDGIEIPGAEVEYEDSVIIPKPPKAGGKND